MATPAQLNRVKRACKIAIDNVKARGNTKNGGNHIPEDTGALKRSLKYGPLPGNIYGLRLYVDGRYTNPKTHMRVRDYYKYIDPITNPGSNRTNSRNTGWWDATAMEVLVEMAAMLNGKINK